MLTAIGDVMREAYKRGWITTRDGNCSLRKRGVNKLYITPSGVRKVTIIPETIVRIPITNGKLSLGNHNASGELEMHWLLQKSDLTRSVLHLHPTNIIAAMYAGFDLQKLASEFPEVSRYTRVGPTVPILPVTSDILAEKTFEAFTSSNDLQNTSHKIIYDIVGQKNHGVCAVGKHPWDAFEHIERLEHICEIVLNSR